MKYVHTQHISCLVAIAHRGPSITHSLLWRSDLQGCPLSGSHMYLMICRQTFKTTVSRSKAARWPFNSLRRGKQFWTGLRTISRIGFRFADFPALLALNISARASRQTGAAVGITWDKTLASQSRLGLTGGTAWQATQGSTSAMAKFNRVWISEHWASLKFLHQKITSCNYEVSISGLT